MRKLKRGSVAKGLWGSERTAFITNSFKNKVEAMELVLASWRNNKVSDGTYWPRTLKELKEWNDPDRGIYSWSSDSVASKVNMTYSDLTDRYWICRNELKNFDTKKEDKLSDLKSEIAALSAKNALLIMRNMELSDALSRHDPNNKILKRILS